MDGSLGECIQADAGGGEDLSQNDIKEIRHQSEDGVADAPYYQLGMSRKITIRFESMRYRLEGPKGVMISSEELNDAAREAYRKRKQLKCPQVSRSPVLESRKDGPFSLEIYKAGMMKEVGDFPPRKGFTPLHSFRYSLYDYAGTHLSDRAWCLCDKFTQPEWAEAIEINDIKFPHKQFRVTSATPRENIFGFRDICFNFGTISPQDEEYNLSPEEVKLVVSKITGAWKLSCKGTAPCWVFPDHTGLDVDRGIYFEVYKNVATPNREGRYPHAGCYGSDNYDRSQPHKSSRKFPQGFYPYSYKDSGAYEAHQPHNSQYRTEHYNGGYPAHYVKPTAYTGRAPTVANPHPNNPASGYSSHNLNDPMLFESFNGRKNMRESLLTSGDYVRRGTRQARSRSRHKFQGYSHDNYEEPYASGRRSSSHPRESVNYVSPRGGITQRRPRSRSRPAHQDEGYDHDERRHTSYAAPKRESYPESDPLYVYVNVDTPQPRGRSKSRHGQGMYG